MLSVLLRFPRSVQRPHMCCSPSRDRTQGRTLHCAAPGLCFPIPCAHFHPNSPPASSAEVISVSPAAPANNRSLCSALRLGKGRGCEAVEHRSTGMSGLPAACPHPSILSWVWGSLLAPSPVVGLWDVGHADALHPHLRLRISAVQHVAVRRASPQTLHKETCPLRKTPCGFFLASLVWERIHPTPLLLSRLGFLQARVSVPSLCLGSPCPLWFSPLGDEVLDHSSSMLGRIRLLSHLLPAWPHPTLGTGTAGMVWQGRVPQLGLSTFVLMGTEGEHPVGISHPHLRKVWLRLVC